MAKSNKKNNSKIPQEKVINNGQFTSRDRVILGSIIVFTLFLFAKVITFDFTNWDDYDYVVNNPLIKNVSLKGVADIFKTPVIGMYNPFTFLVYLIEYALFGMSPKMFHLFNLLFHLIAVVLAYKFTLKLSKRYETAVIVALLLAIHPMHVTVVAWVSQTKTSLMAIFYLLSLISYLKYLEDTNLKKHLYIGVIYFIVSVLFKPDAVTITLILFLIDYYKNRTFSFSSIIEKGPYLLVSLLFGIITLVSHLLLGDQIFEINHQYTLSHTLMIANYGLVFYINKFFMPMYLLAIYPYPEIAEYLPFKYYLSLLVLPSIGFIIYKAGTLRKDVIFGFLFFVLSISVLLRLMPSGHFRASNQYSYLPHIGLSFAIGQAFVFVLGYKDKYANFIRNSSFIGLSIFFVFISYRVTIRVETWRDSITLYDDIIKKKPSFSLAYKNRGNAKLAKGDRLGAFKDYEYAFKFNPKDLGSVSNMGYIRMVEGNRDEALLYYNKAIQLDSNLALAYNNRGILYHQMGDTISAIKDWRKAASLGSKEAIAVLKTEDSEYYQMYLSKYTSMR